MRNVSVNVKYLSALRDRTGLRGEVIDLPAGSALEDLVRLLRERHGIDCTDRRLMFVVNGRGWRQYPRELRTPVQEGDTVLLMPPVSGG